MDAAQSLTSRKRDVRAGWRIIYIMSNSDPKRVESRLGMRPSRTVPVVTLPIAAALVRPRSPGQDKRALEQLERVLDAMTRAAWHAWLEENVGSLDPGDLQTTES